MKDARQQKEEAKVESLDEIFIRIEGCQCYLNSGKRGLHKALLKGSGMVDNPKKPCFFWVENCGATLDFYDLWTMRQRMP